MHAKPRIGVFLGDPTGIGPEVVVKLLAEKDVLGRARVVVIGDQRVFRMAEEIVGHTIPVKRVDRLTDGSWEEGLPLFIDYPTIAPDEFQLGRESAQAGRSVIETLAFALDLARQKAIDGLVYAPLNKQNLRLGGFAKGSEMRFFAQQLAWDKVAEINIVGELWTSRVTSHVPLKDVSSLITIESVLDAIDLIHHQLRRFGLERPRIAVAALNPHAGEGGLFGTEEQEVIGPAVQQARGKGIHAAGPFPADTVFVAARNGEYDAVVTMYHDQGQIAMKLMGFQKGVTLAGGLPIPITTPAHGTAHNIAGQNKAQASGIRHAFLVACRLVGTQRD